MTRICMSVANERGFDSIRSRRIREISENKIAKRERIDACEANLSDRGVAR